MALHIYSISKYPEASILKQKMIRTHSLFTVSFPVKFPYVPHRSSFKLPRLPLATFFSRLVPRNYRPETSTRDYESPCIRRLDAGGQGRIFVYNPRRICTWNELEYGPGPARLFSSITIPGTPHFLARARRLYAPQ